MSDRPWHGTASRRCWAEAPAVEVIDLKQLQGYKAAIEPRRQREAQELQHSHPPIGYDGGVRQHRTVFTGEEQLLAFEAPDRNIAWTPGEPLRI